MTPEHIKQFAEELIEKFGIKVNVFIDDEYFSQARQAGSSTIQRAILHCDLLQYFQTL